MTVQDQLANTGFTTHDRDLVVILWALGFCLKPDGVSREYKILYFTFERSPELDEIVQKYHAGDRIDVDLSRLWVAYMLFQNHMHDPAKDRKVVVSMMTLGHKPVEKFLDANEALRYKFSDDAQGDIWKYLSNENFTVNAKDFWMAQRQFVADIRSL